MDKCRMCGGRDTIILHVMIIYKKSASPEYSKICLKCYGELVEEGHFVLTLKQDTLERWI